MSFLSGLLGDKADNLVDQAVDTAGKEIAHSDKNLNVNKRGGEGGKVHLCCVEMGRMKMMGQSSSTMRSSFP